MGEPRTPDRFIAILKAEGVNVAEYPGWRTRERDSATGKPFGPVHGVLNHHTAGTDSLKAVAYTGRPDLPPPLAHIHLAKSGLATMCSAGRANHAGLAAKNAYDAIVNESSTHPAPLKASGTVDGNDALYGIETENLGDLKDTYTRAQYDAWVRINAAICREFGWGADSCAGHLETSVEGKVDPRGPVEGYGTRGRFILTMRQMRADVDERLKHPASWNPSGTTPSQEDDMPTAAEVAKAVLTYDGVISVPGAPATNPTWTLSSSVTEILKRQDKANATLAAQKATIDKLVDAVAILAANVGDIDPATVVAELKAAIETEIRSIEIHLDTTTA